MVANKIDLLDADAVPGPAVPGLSGNNNNNNTVAISCSTGDGVNALVDRLVKEVQARTQGGEPSAGSSADPPLITRARHRHHVESAVGALDAFHDVGGELELAAEELRVRDLPVSFGVVYSATSLGSGSRLLRHKTRLPIHFSMPLFVDLATQTSSATGGR